MEREGQPSMELRNSAICLLVSQPVAFVIDGGLLVSHERDCYGYNSYFCYVKEGVQNFV